MKNIIMKTVGFGMAVLAVAAFSAFLVQMWT